MKKHTRISIFLVSILASLVVSPSYAVVGKVIFTHGTVSVERPDPDVLTTGMPVDEGDVIVTGANGYVQLLLEDSTKLAIRPDSRFTILALETPAEGGNPAIGAGLTPRAEFSLERGGFRTLTGEIASKNPSSYQVSTPNAVIGIRGTNYVARLCSGDCNPGTEDGLFVGVSDGAIYLNNNGGELDLARNQYGYARNFNVAPVRLIAPPASLQDEGLDVLLEEEEEEESENGEGEETASSGEDGEESEGDSDAEEAASEFGGDSEVADTEAASSDSSDPVAAVPSEPEQEISANGGEVDLTDPGNADLQLFSFSTSDFALGTVVSGSSLTEDDAGNLVAFEARGTEGVGESYDIGTAAQSNTGFDPLTELKWGRWSDGIATVDGTELDLTNSSLHFVVAPDQDQPTQVITGTANYVLIGNTDPTDNNGHVGLLGDAQLFADFTNQTVQSDVLLSINNQVWEASGSGAITQALFNGLYETVTINGSATGTGSFGGFFAGFGDGAPAGAGLNYNLINGGTIVNGAAVLQQAP